LSIELSPIELRLLTVPQPITSLFVSDKYDEHSEVGDLLVANIPELPTKII
jgi:hypothetical protein